MWDFIDTRCPEHANPEKQQLVGAGDWGTRGSARFQGDENVLELDTVLAVRPCECTKCCGTVYFKMLK